MTLGMTWSGGRGLLERLRRAELGAQRATDAALRQAGEEIRRRAAEHVHEQRDAGRPLPSELAESLRVAVAEERVEVRAEAPHAAFVEFGTSRTEAAPFLKPAIDAVAARLARRSRGDL